MMVYLDNYLILEEQINDIRNKYHSEYEVTELEK